MNSKPSSPLRWGIIGPGSIAKAFAGGVAHSQTGKLVAIATRNPGKPGLAEAFPGARILDGYEAMLADPEVDAIYIATPASRPRRMGDQGRRGRQARAGRKADRRSAPSRPTPSSTPHARPAPSPAKPSCTGCTRRPPSWAN